jgi:hypothetical protein
MHVRTIHHGAGPKLWHPPARHMDGKAEYFWGLGCFALRTVQDRYPCTNAHMRRVRMQIWRAD